jgi:hypothetical protein
MRILHLTLKKKWYDMIEAGIKLEEYREIKLYWIKRLVDFSAYPKETKTDHRTLAENLLYDYNNGHSFDDCLKSYYAKIKQFDVVHFKHGYARNTRTMSWECRGIDVGDGNHEWGGGSDVFRIKLAPILNTPSPV